MSKMAEFDLALNDYFAAMQKDFVQWSRGNSGYGSCELYADKPGQKFLRIWSYSDGVRRSSHSFIVLKDCTVTKAHPLYSKKPKEVLKLRVGDILKCASWKAPALNFVRGNILDGNYGECSWTGAQ